MPQYEISFSKNLAEVSAALLKKGLDTPDARRTVIYLSRLAMELTLKALLELAGKPILEIKQHWHDLQSLLADVESYEFEMRPDGQWHSGAEIRKLKIQYNTHLIDMDAIIEAEKYGASKFPNEVRYGDKVQDVAPEILAPASLMLALWASLCTGNAHRGGPEAQHRETTPPTPPTRA